MNGILIIISLIVIAIITVIILWWTGIIKLPMTGDNTVKVETFTSGCNSCTY